MSVNQLVSYSTDDVWIKTMFVLSPFSQKKDCSFSFLNRICGQKGCKIIFSFVEIQPRKKQSIDSPSLPSCRCLKLLVFFHSRVVISFIRFCKVHVHKKILVLVK